MAMSFPFGIRLARDEHPERKQNTTKTKKKGGPEDCFEMRLSIVPLINNSVPALVWLGRRL